MATTATIQAFDELDHPERPRRYHRRTHIPTSLHQGVPCHTRPPVAPSAPAALGLDVPVRIVRRGSPTQHNVAQLDRAPVSPRVGCGAARHRSCARRLAPDADARCLSVCGGGCVMDLGIDAPRPDHGVQRSLPNDQNGMAVTGDFGRGLGSVPNVFPRVDDVALLVGRIAAADCTCRAGGCGSISSGFVASRLVAPTLPAGQLREECAQLAGAALANPQ